MERRFHSFVRRTERRYLLCTSLWSFLQLPNKPRRKRLLSTQVPQTNFVPSYIGVLVRSYRTNEKRKSSRYIDGLYLTCTSRSLNFNAADNTNSFALCPSPRVCVCKYMRASLFVLPLFRAACTGSQRYYRAPPFWGSKSVCLGKYLKR